MNADETARRRRMAAALLAAVPPERGRPTPQEAADQIRADLAAIARLLTDPRTPEIIRTATRAYERYLREKADRAGE